MARWTMDNENHYIDKWGCFDCPNCGAGVHVSWGECASCDRTINVEETKHPEPGDEGYEEWLSELIGCDNCGSTEHHKEELRFGYLRGSLVKVCSGCGYPYFHEGSTYG